MNRSAKGALAAAAAGVLLLGGAGTLAYWTDTGPVTGGDIASGHLKLTDQSCAGWKLDGGAAYTTQKIVPGDSLTQECTFTVDADGSHLNASFTATTPDWASASDDDLTGELTAIAAFKVGTTTVDPATPVTVADGDVVTSTVTVTFTGISASNDSEDLAAHLDDIVVTATQGHSAT